jgi:hypothetical protein
MIEISEARIVIFEDIEGWDFVRHLCSRVVAICLVILLENAAKAPS